MIGGAEMDKDFGQILSEAEEVTGKKAGGFLEGLKKNAVLIGIAIVLIIAVIIGLNAISAGNVAEKVAKATILNDFKAMGKYSAYSFEQFRVGDYDDEDEFYEDKSDYYDEDISSWSDLCKVAPEYVKEDLEDYFGDFKLTVEATKVKDIPIRKLKSECEYMIDELEEMPDFDIDDYSKAKVVTVKYKIDGDDDKEKGSYDVYLVKDGITWKVVDCN